MKTVSLKIDDSIFNETEKIITRIKKPRNRYINDALEHYNRFNRKLMLQEKLKFESHLVRGESLAVLKEFEQIDYVD